MIDVGHRITEVLMIFRFETGDSSCRYWDEAAIVHVPSAELKEVYEFIEDSIVSYCDAGLDDVDYHTIVDDNLRECGFTYRFIGSRKIDCDTYQIFEL